MNERRFDDDEIAEILARATRPRASTPASPDESTGSPVQEHGLTLTELETVAAEAGIAPQRIRDAARDLGGGPGTSAHRTLLGMTRSVSREIPLPSSVDDAVWERVVALARATFGARGESTAEGALRSWTTDDVEAHLEPDPSSRDGWRLRVVSENTADVEGLELAGLLLALGLTALVAAALGAASGLVWVGIALIVIGAGTGGWTAHALPRWARTREDQIDELARGLAPLLDEPHQGPPDA